MAKDVFIPKLGQTVEEVTIVQWLADDGAKVDQGQEILEVETDKAVFAVESTAKGYLHRGQYAAGDVVPVLTVVGIIGKADETFSAAGWATPAAEAVDSAGPESLPEASAPPTPPGAEHDRIFASPRARKLAAERNVDLATVPATGGGGQRIAERDVVAHLSQVPKATPLAQRVAAQAGVDLRGVTGTGPSGRITREDVDQARRPAPAPAVATAPAPAPVPPAAPLPEVEITERIPLKGVRAIIADRMGTSVHTTARVTLMMEVDATEFVAMRERLKAKVADVWGFAPAYNDLIARIVAIALRQFPYVNARLAPDAIERLAHVNLGLAVDTERGLLVPVIRDADTKSVREIGAEFRALAERARTGRSLPDDLVGGSFTITNLGMYDIDAFTPVINLPEAAILGLGRIAPKVVPYKGEIAIRQMWTLSLVFDHRVVDGAPAARFLQAIKGMVEEPYLLLAL